MGVIALPGIVLITLHSLSPGVLTAALWTVWSTVFLILWKVAWPVEAVLVSDDGCHTECLYAQLLFSPLRYPVVLVASAENSSPTELL